jgi:hypothetical protein
MFGHRYERAFRNALLDFRPYRRQQPSKPFTIQTFAPYPDNRRPGAAGQGKDSVKIGVESDTYAMFEPSILQDGSVIGLAQPDFANVNDVPTFRVQNSGRGTGNALIQQQPFQAASREYD